DEVRVADATVIEVTPRGAPVPGQSRPGAAGKQVVEMAGFRFCHRARLLAGRAIVAVEDDNVACIQTRRRRARRPAVVERAEEPHASGLLPQIERDHLGIDRQGRDDVAEYLPAFPDARDDGDLEVAVLLRLVDARQVDALLLRAGLPGADGLEVIAEAEVVPHRPPGV